jgi:hypothetical protein
VVNRARFLVRVSTHTFKLPTAHKTKNKIDLKFPKQTLSFAIPPSSLIVEFVVALMCRIAGYSV